MSENDRKFVTALARGLDVLAAFHPEDAALPTRTLALRTGLPKSTLTRLTHTLERTGWLVAESGGWRLGPGAMRLARSFLDPRRLHAGLGPAMQALAEATDAAVALAERDGLEMVYLDYRRGPAPVVVALGTGARLPLLASAAGHAVLAALPGAMREALLARLHAADPAGARAHASALREAGKSLAARGFVAAHGTWRPGVNAIGVPLPGTAGRDLALTLAAPAGLIPPERMERELAPKLVALAASL